MRWNGGSKKLSRTYVALGRVDHLPRQMTVDSGPAVFTWTLSDIKVNPQLDRSVFTYTPPPDPVDSKTHSVLAAMANAYASLKSYSSRNYLKVTGQVKYDACTSIVLQRPNFGSVKTLSGKKTTCIISNGKHLLSFNSSEKGPYDRAAAPSDWYRFVQKAGEIDPQSAYDPDWFKPGDPLGVVGIGHRLESLVTSLPSTVAGTAVDLLEGKFRAPGGTISIRAYVDHDDHLLLRLTYDMGSAMSADLVFTGVKANPPLAVGLFNARPPRGAQLQK